MKSTSFETATYSSPVYADPVATMSGGTPLIVAVSRSGHADEYHITVKLQLLQAYERAIFELQQQLVHYRALVENLLPRAEPPEVLLLESTALNPASVRLLDSIVRARASMAAQRGCEEADEV